MNILKSGLLATAVVSAAVAHAQIFIIQTPPPVLTGSLNLINGASVTVNANAISAGFANAIVGDTVPAPRSGNIFLQYDAVATNQTSAFFPGILLNVGGNVRGSGRITITEQIFALDSNFNELGGPIATGSVVFTNNIGVFTHSSLIPVNYNGFGIRVKKQMVLETLPDGPQYDIASLSYVNQAVVPEPASMTALALGAAAMLRRRKK